MLFMEHLKTYTENDGLEECVCVCVGGGVGVFVKPFPTQSQILSTLTEKFFENIV